MRVSINWLSENFRKHAATIKKRTAEVPKDDDGKMDLAVAAEFIYIGGGGTTEEVIRQLNIKRTQEIDLDMEIKRGDRILYFYKQKTAYEIFQAFAGTVKANRNKVLDDALINEIFSMLRDWAQRQLGPK